MRTLLPSEQTPQDPYYTAAVKLCEVIKANGAKSPRHGLTTAPRLHRWADDLRRLGAPHRRLMRAIRWLRHHGTDTYTPIIRSARALCQKFSAVENAIDRTADAVPVVISSEVEALVYNRIGYYNPADAAAELAFVQRCYENYKAWGTALSRLGHMVTYGPDGGPTIPAHPDLDAHIVMVYDAAFGTVADEVTAYTHTIWELAARWGSDPTHPPMQLGRHVWSPRCNIHKRRCALLALPYVDDGMAGAEEEWSKIQAVLDGMA